MKFSHVLAFATAAAAIPQSWVNWQQGQNKYCVNEQIANDIVEKNRIFQLHADIPAARAAAESLFAGDDYREYGDSINALRGDPLGTLVEANATIYITEVLSTPPLMAINTLGVTWSCNLIMWHYELLGVGGPMGKRIHGFSKITVDLSRSGPPVTRQDVEFNSLTWATDTGFTVAPPTTGEYAPQKSAR